MTSPTVCTTVPLAARGASQSRKLRNVSIRIDWLPGSQESQTACSMIGTQPPPLASARVT